MHADRPGDRPRLLYWYRTAPGIALGRSPLDEDAIRTIEEQHPDIDFDWPAILALSEVMTPEDEAPARPPQREQRQQQQQGRRQKPPRDQRSREQQPETSADEDVSAADANAVEETPAAEMIAPREEAPPRVESPRPSGLVDQLAGREIASRLRSRYDEIVSRIQDAGAASRESLLQRAESLDPDRWDTPEAVLQGVTNADSQFEQLRAAIHSSRE